MRGDSQAIESERSAVETHNQRIAAQALSTLHKHNKHKEKTDLFIYCQFSNVRRFPPCLGLCPFAGRGRGFS